MATAVGDLVINLLAKNKASGPINAAGKSLNQLGGIASKVAGMLGASLSLAGLGYGLVKSVRLAEEQIKVEQKLAAVLNATGNAAGLTADEMKAYASQLQRSTNFGDEAIINAEALLATFKQIRGGVFKEATAAALDMATVMGTDLNSAIVQIGKALNDPIQGMSALSEVGVSFTRQQKDQITTMQRAGDVAGAQAVILRELQSEFGGAAEAMADPWTQMKNALGDFLEVIGGTLVPYVRLAATSMKDWLTSAQGDMTATGGAAATLTGIIGTIADTVQLVTVAWDVLKVGVTATIKVMVDGVVKLLEMTNRLGQGLRNRGIQIAEAVGLGADVDRSSRGGMQAAINFGKAFSEELGRTVEEQLGDAMDSLAAKTPSEKAAELAEKMKQAAGYANVAAAAFNSIGPAASFELPEAANNAAALAEIQRALQTPIEALEAKLADAKRLLTVGAIDQGTFGKYERMIQDQINEELSKATGDVLDQKNVQTALRGSAATKGSPEFYSRIFAAMDGGKGNPANATAENTKAIRSDMARMREGIDEMRRGKVKMVTIEEAAG